MSCGHQCFEIGGPWIAENPSCLEHGFSESKSQMHTSNYVVVIENEYSAKVLLQGTYVECQEYITNNPEICGSEAFIQELDFDYNPE